MRDCWKISGKTLATTCAAMIGRKRNYKLYLRAILKIYKWSLTSAHKSFLIISGRLSWKLSNNVFCLVCMYVCPYCDSRNIAQRLIVRVASIGKKMAPFRHKNLSHSRMTLNKKTKRAGRGLNKSQQTPTYLLTKQKNKKQSRALYG